MVAAVFAERVSRQAVDSALTSSTSTASTGGRLGKLRPPPQEVAEAEAGPRQCLSHAGQLRSAGRHGPVTILCAPRALCNQVSATSKQQPPRGQPAPPASYTPRLHIERGTLSRLPDGRRLPALSAGGRRRRRPRAGAFRAAPSLALGPIHRASKPRVASASRTRSGDPPGGNRVGSAIDMFCRIHKSR